MPDHYWQRQQRGHSTKLQNEISISNMEAECIAMSQATRDLSLIHAIFHEFVGFTKLIVGDTVPHSIIF